MNMRNGSVVSFTISNRGNKSFAIGVAVCLRESVDGVRDWLIKPSARVLEYLFHSFSACFSATYKFATDEIKSERSEDEIIQYHVLAVNTQK